jgi:chromosome segregation ATPase
MLFGAYVPSHHEVRVDDLTMALHLQEQQSQAVMDHLMATSSAAYHIATKRAAFAEAQLLETNTRLADCSAKLADRDAKLADRDAELADRDAKLADRDAELADRDAKLVICDAQTVQKCAETLEALNTENSLLTVSRDEALVALSRERAANAELRKELCAAADAATSTGKMMSAMERQLRKGQEDSKANTGRLKELARDFEEERLMTAGMRERLEALGRENTRLDAASKSSKETLKQAETDVNTFGRAFTKVMFTVATAKSLEEYIRMRLLALRGASDVGAFVRTWLRDFADGDMNKFVDASVVAQEETWRAEAKGLASRTGKRSVSPVEFALHFARERCC